jgi:hypothetical protein
MGGCPDSVHDSAPPQSPVWQLPLPPLKEHPVRPHTLPDWVPAGTSTVHVCPGSSCVPPPTGVAAGHTVEPQLLVMVNVAALALAAKAASKSNRTAEGDARLDVMDTSYLSSIYVWTIASQLELCSVEELGKDACLFIAAW